MGYGNICFMRSILMRIEDVLDNIENFEDAYYERLIDLNLVKSQQRKCLAMHLGGIIIECRLKQLIMKKMKLVKQVSCYWCNASIISDLRSKENTFQNLTDVKRHLKSVAVINTLHNFQDALKLLPEIDVGRPSNIFESVSDPLQRNRESYIALRYNSDAEFSDVFFANWYDNFVEARKWIEKRVSVNREVFR